MAMKVIPICAAAKNTSGLLERSSALFALLSPFSDWCSSLALRTETSAISDITNKPLIKISTSSIMISIYATSLLSKLTNPNRLLKKVPVK